MPHSAKKGLCVLVGVFGLIAGTPFSDAISEESPGMLTANISAYSGSKPFAGGLAEIDAFNRGAASSVRRLMSGIRGVDVRTQSNTGVYEGWVEPSLTLTIGASGALQKEQVLSCLAAFARHYSQHQIHVLQPGSAEATPDKGDFDTDIIRFTLPRPLTRREIDRVIAASGLPGMTFNSAYAEIYYAGEPGDDNARAKFRTSGKAASQEIDRIAGKHVPASNSITTLQIYGEGKGASPYAKISATACPGNF